MDDCVLAVDLGGSSLRVALIGRDGRVRALHVRAHRERDEANPEHWWQGVVAGADVLRRKDRAGFAAVRAVAVTAFTRSLVLLDAQGVVLRPAMLFGDARAEAVVAEVRERLAKVLLPPLQPSPASAGEGAGCALTPYPALAGEGWGGGRATASQHETEAQHLNAFHPLARLYWLAQTVPNIFADAAYAIEPKDYLNHRLTGIVATDAISSARLVASEELLPALGLPSLLPPLHHPTAPMGHVQPDLPGALATLAGVPVLTMAHDTWAAVLGLGALRAGCGYCISGTTEVLGLLHDAPAHADGLLTVAWDALWQIGGPSQHGADLLTWLHELGLDPLDTEPHDPVPILFLPSLDGERVPHWDPALRGAFLGLRRDHDKRDIARSVMLGVALNNRSVLQRAETATGVRAEEIRLGGGGAMPGWAQLRADVLGRPVVLTDCDEPGLLGCAIAGFAAVEGVSLDAMQHELIRVTARCEPDPHRHARATQLHALFLQAEHAVAPISRALAALR